MIVGISGHRPHLIGGFYLPNPIYNFICQELDRLLTELKPDKIISGMALGVDQWAASIAYKLGVPFIAAIPCDNQEKLWLEDSKRIYYSLLNKADEKIIVSSGEFSAVKMQIRNEWIVDHCDKLIAVYGESKGGTYNCIRYAKQCNKEILIIDPRKYNA